jgi:hypothetical protein
LAWTGGEAGRVLFDISLSDDGDGDEGEPPPASPREPPVRSQARWLKDQRRGRGLTPKREAFLDRVLPGWRNGFQPGVKPRQFQI